MTQSSVREDDVFMDTRTGSRLLLVLGGFCWTGSRLLLVLGGFGRTGSRLLWDRKQVVAGSLMLW